IPILATSKLGPEVWLGGACCIFASLGFYQTGINAFFVFLVVEFAFLQLNRVAVNKLLSLLLFRMTQVSAGLLFYILLSRTLVRGAYNKQHFTIITKLSQIGIIARNWNEAWHFILGSLTHTQRLIFLTPVFLGALLLFSIGLSYLRFLLSRKAGKLVTIPLLVSVLILPICWIAGSLGPVLLPVNAIITLPRIHVGLGSLLSSSFVLIYALLSRIGLNPKWLSLPFGIPAYTMIMFASLFGNALKEQKQFEDRIATELHSDIRQISSTRPVDHVIMQGTLAYAPTIRKAMDRYKLLRFLVSIDFRTDRNEGGYLHNKLRYYDFDRPPAYSDETRSAILRQTDAMIPLRFTEYYKLYVVQNYLVINFTTRT
ncbi:MAG: hypothetical protein JO076_11435, partial [Verrucomicrobia bacterium]|nr:hypothetical protein [Verrucomicrobiota bacterium]